jgi:N-acetylglucosaminyl-diphospho-decaprenol L-rhamnosyltransferase
VGPAETLPSGPTASVVVPTVTPPKAVRLLDSLARCEGDFETILIDNGTGAAELERATARLDAASVVRAGENLGYSRAMNLGARRAQGDVLVLLNDDVTLDLDYVRLMAAALDPGAAVVMAAGVMRDSRAPKLIETAGIELDRTLLAFDYLNGQKLSVLDRSVPDPVGPSGVAAAFSRDVFLDVGGFDEELFAYLEDVDLALRVRVAGGRCRLVRAFGVHDHSGTFRSGSARKDFLMGFGRGYLLRKWGVLTPGRFPAVIVRELAICIAQAVVDRNVAGVRGRAAGLRAARERRPYPPSEALGSPPTLRESLGRRWKRRMRLRGRA